MFSTPEAVFTCPACNRSTRHPQDVAAGYCPACHWWTGDPELLEAQPEPPAPRYQPPVQVVPGMPEDRILFVGAPSPHPGGGQEVEVLLLREGLTVGHRRFLIQAGGITELPEES